ncbi:hypothetical protein [Streptacidiphilus sp. MAP5-3]|uniref:hypothetical protein n=1 Tax=unclassified Streptacidiphilus TaxID=2643834 RepID=UPI0035176F36
MTTDTNWSDWPVQAEPTAQAEQSRRPNRIAIAVLASLVVLATVAVGLVVLLGATADAAGGCGGG